MKYNFSFVTFFFFAISFLETDYGETHWASSMLTFQSVFGYTCPGYITCLGLKWEVGCWSQFQVKPKKKKKRFLNLCNKEQARESNSSYAYFLEQVRN